MAESFGTDAARYDRARPRYPEALVRRIVAAAPGPGPGPELLDVGCGTGIAARQFQAAGCRVLGVEPDERMAEVARQFGVDVDVERFEARDPGGRRFDAVVAGQAWHWIHPVAGAAAAARVLRPGGLLAVFWNVFQLPPEVGEALSAVYRRVMPEVPGDLWAKPALDVYAEMFTKASDGIRQAGTFSGPEQWRYDWEHSYTREEWLDQLPTHGANSRLTPAELEELLAGAGAAVDELGGSITVRYTTVAVTATRTAAPTVLA